MDTALSTVPSVAAPRWRTRCRVALARGRWFLGWVGVLGVVLLAGALVAAVLQHAASSSPRQRGPDSVATNAKPELPASPAEAATELRLPRASEIPVILDRMASIAAAQGMGWPRAEYRYLRATAELPASIELQCKLKSTYPAVRKFVSAVLREWPSSTLRELQMQRAGTDTPEVEARMTIVVFVADEVRPEARLPEKR